MTGSTVAAQVRYLTKDVYPSTGAYATDANVLSFINLAQIEIASRTKHEISSNVPNDGTDPTDLTVANQRLYSFPTSALEIVLVMVGTQRLVRKDLATLAMSGSSQPWKYSGTATNYYIENLAGVKKIGIWPIPSAGQKLAIWFVRKPTDLAAIGSSLDLDARLNQAVIYFCAEKCMEGRLKYAEYATYFKRMYEDQINLFINNAADSLESVPFLTQTSSPTD